MPPIWIFTWQDTLVVPSYLRSLDKVQVSGEALGLVQTSPKKNDTAGPPAWLWGLWDGNSQYKSQKHSVATHSTHLCLSFPNPHAKIIQKHWGLFIGVHLCPSWLDWKRCKKNEVQTARHQISKDNKFRDLRQLHNMSHFKSSQSHTWQSIPLTLSKVILKFQNSSTHQNPDQSALFPSHFSCNHHQCLWKRKAEMQQPLKWTPWDKH